MIQLGYLADQDPLRRVPFDIVKDIKAFDNASLIVFVFPNESVGLWCIGLNPKATACVGIKDGKAGRGVGNYPSHFLQR